MFKPIGLKMTAAVEFGGESKFLNDTTYAKVLPQDGKWPVVKNAIVMLNFMGSKGWRCIQYYTSEIQGVQIQTYLLEKREAF
jgi:hypothetical protein